ncbi:MAG: hypothetical protein RIQ78_1412 [Bacteroidota bacterium]|jgi:hypothetical protein
MSGYSPTQTHHYCGDSERTRTSNLLIRSQVLYPLSHGAKYYTCFSGGKDSTALFINPNLVSYFWKLYRNNGISPTDGKHINTSWKVRKIIFYVVFVELFGV